jgi:hypothetical protein
LFVSFPSFSSFDLFYFLSVLGCCWLLLAAAGCCWLLLADAGCCWLLLATACCCWLLLTTAGCCWLLLAGRTCLYLGSWPICLYFTYLGLSARIWPIWTYLGIFISFDRFRLHLYKFLLSFSIFVDMLFPWIFK